MWTKKFRELLLSTQNEAQGREPLRTYLRYWIIAVPITGLLFPFTDFNSALMAGSSITFIFLLLIEFALSKVATPENQKCNVVCRATLFIVFLTVLPASIILNAVDTLSRPQAFDEHSLPEWIADFLVLPLILIVSVYSIRQLRRNPADER